MKHLKHLLFTLPMLLIAMSFAGCNTEEVDPVIPELEIAEELTGEALESLTLQFDAAESSKTFAVRCNRAWTAVSSNADWCVVNPDEGNGDNTLTVTVSRNTGTSRKAEIIISTILFKRSIYIEQKGEQADAKVIFFDNLDGEAASKDSNDKWPYANEFQKYNKKGTGAAEVTYGSYSVTVRSNSPSNDTKYNNSDYSINEASGVNNLYFAANGNFTVNKIALEGEQKLHMEWGVERNEYGNYDAPFNPDEFIVSLSADGQKWSKLTYTRSDYSAWDKASADFQLKEAVEHLYIKMEASVATRVDDIKLTTGAGGQEIDLAAGEAGDDPEQPSVDGTKLYYESFDGIALTENTNLDAFDAAGGFVRQGLGGASASYVGTTFNFRKTSASTGYAGASGGNNAFGNNVDVVFVVNNINVGTAQNIDLSMGLNTYGTYTASEFEAYYTTDGGTTYKPLTLTRSADKAWQLTTASFTVAEAENIVGLKFVSKVAEQQFRIDDLTLSTKDEGVKIEAVPVVKTADATDITMSGATIGGSYEFDGTISEVGVAYKAEGAADYTVEKAIAIQSPFSITLNTLTDGTNYEYYAYVVADGKEYKGDVKTFATEKDQSTAVTYFADDFAAIEDKVVYNSGKWTFTSTDTKWPANYKMGWYGKTFNNGADKYITIAPYDTELTEVVAYAVMTKFNVAEAQGKKLTFDLAWYFKTKDNSKFEVVASKNFTGDVAAATWEVVESYTYTDETINPLNTWTSYSLDLSTKYAEEKSLAVAFRYTGKSNTYRLDNVEFGAVEAPVDVLTVVTGEATNVTTTTATVAGSYSGVTEAPAEGGVEYRMSGAADYTKVAAAAVAESFSVELSNLVEESTYEYRAYAVKGEETTYGEVKTFTTAAAEEEDPTTPSVTIPELIASMTSNAAVYDADSDYVFEGVVLTDVDGGNYTYNNLIVMTEGATTPNNAVVIYNNPLNQTPSFNAGDKVRVTLKAGVAKTQVRYGVPQLTGITDSEIEKIGEGVVVTPIKISYDKLVEYVNMPVEIDNVQSVATSGVWSSSSANTSHKFTVNGDESQQFVVYVKKAAGVFVDVALATGNGTIKGIASVYSNAGQIVPRNLDDVAGLTGARVEQPKITAAATSMSFVAEGEAKTNELTVAGQGELLLFAKSSDEHFTAAIEGTTLTVTAAANTTTEAKSATVTVYMAESAEAEAVASVEIACSQAAPSTGEDGGETTETWIVEEFTGLNKVYAGTLAFNAKQLTWTFYGCSSRNTTDQAAFPTADAAFTMGKKEDNTATGDTSIVNAYCETAAIAKGVSKLKFDYCGNGKKFKVQVLVGGAVKFEKEFDAYSNTSVTKSSGELAITGATENAVIRFINTSGARRVTIGNISWVTAQ